MSKEDEELNNKIDLREILRLKKNKKVSILGTKSDKNISNVKSTKINNKTNEIPVTNTVSNRRTRDKFTLEEGSTSESDEDENLNNLQDSSPYNNDVFLSENWFNASQETCHSQINASTCEDINIEKECTNDDKEDDRNNEEDDDCISLFAETFDTSQ